MKVVCTLRPNGMREISSDNLSVIFKTEEDGGLYIQGYKDGVLVNDEESLKVFNSLKELIDED